MKFFDLLSEQIDLLCRASDLLLSGLQAGSSTFGNTAAQMKNLERDSDRVVARTVQALAKCYVTPFAPEDLHQLTTTIDDVIDAMEQATYCIGAYRLETISPPVVELSRLVNHSCRVLKREWELVIHRKQLDGEPLEVARFENEADALQRQLISTLFDHPVDPIQMLKHKEIYELLEAITDRCEDVSDMMRKLSLEYA
jgi:uncharacterized protein Yka (UPF0111/DUF47 family)